MSRYLELLKSLESTRNYDASQSSEGASVGFVGSPYGASKNIHFYSQRDSAPRDLLGDANKKYSPPQYDVPTEATKDLSDGFVGTPYSAFENIHSHSENDSTTSNPLVDAERKYSNTPDRVPTEPTKALTVLRSMHAENTARLNGRGIARVMLMHWRKALGMDEIRFRRILLELESSGQIIREHGYARPGVSRPIPNTKE